MSTREWYQTLATFTGDGGRGPCVAKACRSTRRLSIGIAGSFLQPVGNVTTLHEYAHFSFKSDFGYRHPYSLN
jgi:hypothetical protein